MDEASRMWADFCMKQALRNNPEKARRVEEAHTRLVDAVLNGRRVVSAANEYAQVLEDLLAPTPSTDTVET